VGSLGRLRASGEYEAFYSASLIAPDLIVAAKHCNLPARQPLVFALGPDANAPERLVPVLALSGSEPQAGGVARPGSAVAVGRLGESVTLRDSAPGPTVAAPVYGADQPRTPERLEARALRSMDAAGGSRASLMCGRMLPGKEYPSCS
jgi:hypothetical protein